jgi:multidrug efflux pump subunit AcrA (membrane-fusion protein)
MKNSAGKKIGLTRKIIYGAAALAVLAGGGTYAYTKYFYQPPAETSTATLQTTTVKRGDLVLYASGTGSLVAKQTASLGFQNSGKVSAVDVAEGDRVKAGQVLATLDTTSLQLTYNQAKRALAELTSDVAKATAEEAIATAQTEVKDALNTLVYLISPTVYNYEVKLANAEMALAEAQSAAAASPGEENSKKVADAEKQVTALQKSVKSAWYWWAETYVPDKFTTVERTRSGTTKTVNKPTDTAIASARAAYALAQATLQENQYYLAALKGEELPEDATGANLTTLEEAKEALQTAQDNLEKSTIVSPVDGMVTSVTISAGDSTGTDAVIEVVDNVTPTIGFYLDEEDWDNVAPGYSVEVIFDSLPDKTYTGTVTELNPTLVSSNGSTLVYGLAELDNVSEIVKDNLMLGLNASVDVIGGRADAATLVSVDALHEVSPGVFGVFIQKNGSLTFTQVDIGIMDTINAVVLSGLNPGDIVSTGLLETN